MSQAKEFTVMMQCCVVVLCCVVLCCVCNHLNTIVL